MKPNDLKKGVFTLLLASYIVAPAVQAADSNFYAAIDIGRSSVDDNSVPIDEDATGFRLAAGYQFIPWLAVDLGYVDFGTFEATFDDPFGPPITAKASADGLELGLIGRVPLGDKFAITARAGMYWWDSKVVAGGMTEHDSDNDFTYGLGVELALNQTFVLTGAWQNYKSSGVDIDLLTLGLQLRFGGTDSK
jgi:OOP family OmpA-OmpF porin